MTKQTGEIIGRGTMFVVASMLAYGGVKCFTSDISVNAVGVLGLILCSLAALAATAALCPVSVLEKLLAPTEDRPTEDITWGRDRRVPRTFIEWLFFWLWL